MKTTIINLSAVLILLSTSFFAGRIDYTPNSDQQLTDNTDQVIELTTQSEAICTEAILVDGEVIPVVTLPELTIEATYTRSTLVHAIVKDGNVVPYVTLPTLNIEG